METTNQNRSESEWTGTSIALREYRRGSGISLDIDPRIDLTAPIYAQAAKLASEDENGSTYQAAQCR